MAEFFWGIVIQAPPSGGVLAMSKCPCTSDTPYFSEEHFSLRYGRLHSKQTFFKGRRLWLMTRIPLQHWNQASHFQCRRRPVKVNAANLWRDVGVDRLWFVLTFSRRVSATWWGMSVSWAASRALQRCACTCVQLSFPNVLSEEEIQVHDSKQTQHLPCCYLSVSPAFTLIHIFSSPPANATSPVFFVFFTPCWRQWLLHLLLAFLRHTHTVTSVLSACWLWHMYILHNWQRGKPNTKSAAWIMSLHRTYWCDLLFQTSCLMQMPQLELRSTIYTFHHQEQVNMASKVFLQPTTSALWNENT